MVLSATSLFFAEIASKFVRALLAFQSCGQRAERSSELQFSTLQVFETAEPALVTAPMASIVKAGNTNHN